MRLTEIVDYGASSMCFFVTNTAEARVMILNVAGSTNIVKLSDINHDTYRTGINSVTVHKALLIAVAVERKE